VIRRATEKDAAAVGEIYLRARDEMTYIARFADSDRDAVGSWIVRDNDVWVAEDEEGVVVGFAGLEVGWLNHIYVDPTRQGHGIGTVLLDHAKALQPRGMQLWVFQRNERARHLYERHGFRLVELTDGTGNAEREPDARYEWLP
jgi:ribosomal protein S18 acetylase RimI-like enzyme